MIPKFKASLVHRTSSKLARAIQKTVSGEKKKRKRRKRKKKEEKCEKEIKANW